MVYKGRLFAFWKGINNDANIWYTLREGENNADTWRPQQVWGDSGSNIVPTAAVTEPGNIILGWVGEQLNDTTPWWRLAAWPGNPVTPSNPTGS